MVNCEILQSLGQINLNGATKLALQSNMAKTRIWATSPSGGMLLMINNLYFGKVKTKGKGLMQRLREALHVLAARCSSN